MTTFHDDFPGSDEPECLVDYDITPDEMIRAEELLWQPHAGEVIKPRTKLEAAVLNCITEHGNDNIFVPDPYITGPQRPRLDPNSWIIADSGCMPEYGENFWTHQFDLPLTKVFAVYNVARGGAEVIVDRFKNGGGLDSRTTFSESNDDDDSVYKGQQTDFRTIQGIGFKDYFRPLSHDEINILLKLLNDPNSGEVTALIEALIAVNAEEEAMIKRNRERYELLHQHCAASLMSVVRARQVIMGGEA